MRAVSVRQGGGAEERRCGTRGRRGPCGGRAAGRWCRGGRPVPSYPPNRAPARSVQARAGRTRSRQRDRLGVEAVRVPAPAAPARRRSSLLAAGLQQPDVGLPAQQSAGGRFRRGRRRPRRARRTRQQLLVGVVASGQHDVPAVHGDEPGRHVPPQARPDSQTSPAFFIAAATCSGTSSTKKPHLSGLVIPATGERRHRRAGGEYAVPSQAWPRRRCARAFLPGRPKLEPAVPGPEGRGPGRGPGVPRPGGLGRAAREARRPQEHRRRAQRGRLGRPDPGGSGERLDRRVDLRRT